MMALAGGQVMAIDAHSWIPGSLETMTANMAAYGVADRVAILCETSCSAMPRLAAGEASFGLIFVDGDHQAEPVRHDVGWGAATPWHPAGCSRAMITVRTAAAPACGGRLLSCYPRAASSLNFPVRGAAVTAARRAAAAPGRRGCGCGCGCGCSGTFAATLTPGGRSESALFREP